MTNAWAIHSWYLCFYSSSNPNAQNRINFRIHFSQNSNNNNNNKVRSGLVAASHMAKIQLKVVKQEFKLHTNSLIAFDL